MIIMYISVGMKVSYGINPFGVGECGIYNLVEEILSVRN